jgi:hypothetical protein
VWLDDHTWWLVVVEFQPSSWSQGSYLNVGAMWLWHDKNRLAGDLGGLVADRDVFRQRMTETVRSCRQSLKLEPREVILA